MMGILDGRGRRIVGYDVSRYIDTELALAALDAALPSRRPKPGTCIQHSYRGCQYQMPVYSRRLKQQKVRQSMSRKGDCFDNAMCEAFFATLECELLARTQFHTHEQARQALFSFIEGW
jgi:transposase InsO family protein